MRMYNTLGLGLLLLSKALFAQSQGSGSLRQIEMPSTQDYRSTSPFRICDGRLTTFPPLPSETDRLAYLKSMKSELKKQFLLNDADLNAGFAPAFELNPENPDYQIRLEELTVILNQLEFRKAKLTERATRTQRKFDLFNSAIKREPQASGRNDECLLSPSQKFLDYAAVLRDTTEDLLAGYAFGPPLIETLKKTNLLPSGSRVFFGATTNRSGGKIKVCLNPEEETALLIPKLLHEIAHASNKEIARQTVHYEESKARWLAAKKSFEDVEEQLLKFDDQVDKNSDMNSENLRELVSEIDSADQTVIRSLLQRTAVSKSPYLRHSLEHGIEAQSSLLSAWKLKLDQLEQEKTAAVKERTALDTARFYDEHIAYSVQLFAAWGMVQAEPEFFCRLWVPSFQQKRPVRFFQAFELLESQFYNGTFSDWLANEYSFVAPNYLKTSLYTDGLKDLGLRPEIRKRAREILAEQLRSP